MAKPFTWNPDKNDWLTLNRGFGFEAVVTAIEGGGLLDDAPHPSERHPRQRLYIVDLEGYAVVVPYVEEDDYIFLKTALHDRNTTKRYLNG